MEFRPWTSNEFLHVGWTTNSSKRFHHNLLKYKSYFRTCPFVSILSSFSSVWMLFKVSGQGAPL